MDEIGARLKVVGAYLKDLVAYATSFLDDIIVQQRDSKRRTEIISFSKTEAREVAQRNHDLRYDSSSGYLGYEMKSGTLLFAVSSYDRVLVIRKSGVYSVIDAPEKVFVDKGMHACVLADKEELTRTIFSMIYRDDESKHVYMKRCTIEQFILEKSYTIVPDNCTILKLTTKTEADAVLTYKPRPRLSSLEEAFPVRDYLVKSSRARGVRLSTKEAASAKFVKSDPDHTRVRVSGNGSKAKKRGSEK